MRLLLGLVPLMIFLGLAAHLCLQAGMQPDEVGYTSLRVAENFRSGDGLAFNPGERRDLFESPLWIGLLSLLSFSSQAPLALLALALFLGVLILMLVLGGPREPLVGAGAALFVALDGLFVTRTVTGASEPLVALYLVCLYPILRGAKGTPEVAWGLAIWAGSAGLVRFDLLVVALPVTLGAALREPRRKLAWLPFAAAVVGAVVCGAVRGLVFGARPAFWEPWPPTLPSLLDASNVLLALLLRRPLLCLGIAILVSEWLHGRMWLGRRVGLAWGLVALVLLALAPAQGQEVERLAAPILPLAYLLAVDAVWRRARTRAALVAALLLVVAQPGWTSGGRRFEPEVDVAYARIGRWLATHAAPETLVGAARVGALGYHSGLRVEDVQGRASARVAAARRLRPTPVEDVDAAFQRVFKLEPDLVVLLPGDPVPSARTYVPNDDALPEAIRGPFRLYRWAGSSVWRSNGS